MSIKFKQNGQWVKIPTPSQIDDSAASAATTYSSNKINEIIPQNIAKYLLEHKDELGTDDFTKLKNVPFTTINTTNKSEFTTLKGILDHPDGMYLVDDCGVTNGDEQLTIASFKGHCSTMLMASIAQFQKITDSDEIRCHKGSVIYILTDGNISNGATRYVSICNVPMGVSGGSVEPDRASSDAGTSVVNIEVQAVEDRSSGTVTYSYDIDGGTNTLFNQPQYKTMITSYTNMLVSGVTITGKSNYSPNQLVKVVEDADCQLGYRFTGVDVSEFKSPIIEVNDSNLSSFNTLQKWMNANAGTYLVKTTKLTVSAAGVDKTKSSDNSFSRTLNIPSDTYVYVYSTDDSNSSATNYKNIVFQKADNMPAGYYGEWMVFKWDSRKTYSADNVELYPLMTAAVKGVAGIDMVNELSSVVDTKVDAEYVTNATNNLATKQSVYDVKDLSKRSYTTVLKILGSTDDSAQVLPKLNTTDKSNIVAAINELDARNDKFQENESTSVVLNNHTEYRCKVMASLNLSLPETIPDDYNSRIVFESGETATTLSYTAGSIKFTGDDCDNSNAFVPAANTSYEVDIKYLGLDSLGNKRIVARVGAF